MHTIKRIVAENEAGEGNMRGPDTSSNSRSLRDIKKKICSDTCLS